MSIELKNKDLTVTFSTKGGTLTSIKDQDGVEYLWQGDAEYWSGQAPILFPICGSIRDDKAVIGGDKVCAMPRHGLIRKLEFELVEQSENKVTFAIESDEKMKEAYPYDFRVYATYELKEKEIVVTYEAENKGTERMPFFFGGHPGFNCPINDGESYNDYYIEFAQKETLSVPTPVTSTGLIDVEHRTPFFNDENKLDLKHELFAEDAIIFDELKSRSVKLLSKKSERGVQVDFADYPYLILWSSSNAGDFVAIEPWLGLSTCSDESDVFEEKRNIQYAEVGEKKTYQYSIKVL